jgi:hypothetical protein
MVIPVYRIRESPLQAICVGPVTSTYSAGIFKQSVGARNGVFVPVRQATQPDGFGSLESMHGLP